MTAHLHAYRSVIYGDQWALVEGKHPFAMGFDSEAEAVAWAAKHGIEVRQGEHP